MTTEQQQRSQWSTGRLGIVGGGAMGTCLAAIVGRLAPTVIVETNTDRASVLLKRGARAGGLIQSHSKPIIDSAIDDLPKIGGVSVLFIATKTTAIPRVAAELKGMLSQASSIPEGMLVVSYQNGIEPGEQLMSLLGYDRVLRMVLNLGAHIDKDGDITVLLNNPPHYIGGYKNNFSHECAAISDLLSNAGLETETSPDIERHVWAKGILNAAMNPVAALVNSNIAQVLESPARTIFDALLLEGLAVAKAEGIDLGGQSFVEQSYAVLQRWGKHTPSMVEDIRNGRESEVGQLNRQVMRHGERLAVPTPTHTTIDALIETFDWKVYESSDSRVTASTHEEGGRGRVVSDRSACSVGRRG